MPMPPPLTGRAIRNISMVSSQVVEIAAMDDSLLAKNRALHGVRSGKHPGVRRARGAAFLAAARLDHDQGLSHRIRAVGDSEKLRGSLMPSTNDAITRTSG